MSMDFDGWEPMKEAFQDRAFNSYDRGPGKYLGSTNHKNEGFVKLHVSNIPQHITEDGLRALFSKTGLVKSIWKHKEHGYAFVTMGSSRDAEIAIRKLNNFQIDKSRISVKVAKNDKEKAALIQQKKEEEEFFKKIQAGNEVGKDEDWNKDDYPTFSAIDLEPQNSIQNGRGDTGSTFSKKYSPHKEEMNHRVNNSVSSRNGKTDIGHHEQSNGLESKSKKLNYKANVKRKKQPKPCKVCGNTGTKCCSQCKTPYCSRECQEKDWHGNKHHEECINIYLQNASLEELADRFDVNLDMEGSMNSHSPQKPPKPETPPIDGDHGPASSNKRFQSKKRPPQKYKNDCMDKTPPAKEFQSKQVSPNFSSSTHSSQSDLSPTKISPVSDKTTPNRPFKSAKPNSAKKLDYSSDNNIQKSDFKKKQKSPQKPASQKKLDYNKPGENQTKIKEKVQLPLNKFCEVLVTNVTGCQDIHVQPIEEVNVRMTTYLITELARVYGDGAKNIPCVSSPEVGKIYACCFSADSLWYRAQVVSINDSDITVRYIDYGNTEVTSCEMMRNLIPELKDIPQQAVRCALDVSALNLDNINLLIKQEIGYDLPYKLKMIQAGDPCTIELYNQDGDVGKKLTNLIKSKTDQARSSDGYKSSDDIQQITSGVNMVSDLKNNPGQLKIGNQYSILPFNVISPNDFMVQVVILDEEFNQFNKKLQSCAPLCPPVTQKLDQNQLVLVKKPEGPWCRAEVMRVENGSLTVRLLDLGSMETVSIQNVRSLPPFCLNRPIITVPSKLAEIKPVDKKGWSPDVCTIFQETLKAMNASVHSQDQHILGEYIGSNKDEKFLWKLIDLYTNASIADLLVLDRQAILINPPRSSSNEEKSSKVYISDIPRIPITIGSIEDGIAIDYQSNTFFINLIQSDLKEFQNNFNDFLDSAENSGTNYVASENEIVAAKFSADNKWYRGQILDINEDSVFTVYFIDYGNSELLASSHLQPLPKQFVSYPKQAIRCKLHNATIPEEGLLEFANLVFNNVCKYKIVSENNEIYNVLVYGSNGDCYNDMFKDGIVDGHVSETESLKSEHLTSNSVPDISSETTPEEPLISHRSPTPPTHIAPSQSMPIVEGNFCESSQDSSVLSDPKLSPSSFESRTDSELVSCVDSPRLKYFTKNMQALTLEENTSYKLHCTSVTNADGFYCQLLDDTAIMKYFELMEELAKVCNDSSADLAFLPEKGQLIAAKFFEDWYRAKVIDTHEDSVDVFFIDYGNSSPVPRDQLREISSEIFVEFPILAVRCCLTGISKQKRTNEISTFQDRTFDVKVMGELSNGYPVVFEEDLEEQLAVEDVPSPSPPRCKSPEDDEKERIQRQIEELQRKLATLN